MGDSKNRGGRGLSEQDALAELEGLEFEPDETELVLEWRLDQLERAGYRGVTAVELAERRDVDLHEAVRLVARGCAPGLAARILL